MVSRDVSTQHPLLHMLHMSLPIVMRPPHIIMLTHVSHPPVGMMVVRVVWVLTGARPLALCVRAAGGHTIRLGNRTTLSDRDWIRGSLVG